MVRNAPSKMERVVAASLLERGMLRLSRGESLWPIVDALKPLDAVNFLMEIMSEIAPLLEAHDGDIIPGVRIPRAQKRILNTLLRRPTRIFRREELLVAIYQGRDANFTDIRLVDTHIKRLRRIIAPYGFGVETVHCEGYRAIAPAGFKLSRNKEESECSSSS